MLKDGAISARMVTTLYAPWTCWIAALGRWVCWNKSRGRWNRMDSFWWRWPGRFDPTSNSPAPATIDLKNWCQSRDKLSRNKRAAWWNTSWFHWASASSHGLVDHTCVKGTWNVPSTTWMTWYLHSNWVISFFPFLHFDRTLSVFCVGVVTSSHSHPIFPATSQFPR